MPTLTSEQIVLLRRARRWFRLELLAAAVVIVAGIVLMIVYDYELWAAIGASVGGLMIRIAYSLRQQQAQRVGLDADGAKAALAADRDRRTGADQRTHAQRARRLAVQANIFTALGLLSGALLVAAAVVFFQRAGRTAEEGAPLDLWLPVSFGTGFVTLVATPVLFMQASARRQLAKAAPARRGRRTP